MTAPGSGAEVIPFLKTYVNLPMAIGFTVIYAQVGAGGSSGCHACPELLPPVACCPCLAVACAACIAGCCAVLLPPLLLHAVLPTSVRYLLQPAPTAASNSCCACCSWPMCCPQRRCSTPASSPSLPSLDHLPSSCTPCGTCSTPTVSLTAGWGMCQAAVRTAALLAAAFLLLPPACVPSTELLFMTRCEQCFHHQHWLACLAGLVSHI